MSEPRSLQQVLDRAGRDLPAALPADFVDSVMTRIQGNETSPASVTAPRPLHLALMAAAVVLTACLINLMTHERDHGSQPPPLAIFGGQPAGFELVAP